MLVLRVLDRAGCADGGSDNKQHGHSREDRNHNALRNVRTAGCCQLVRRRNGQATRWSGEGLLVKPHLAARGRKLLSHSASISRSR